MLNDSALYTQDLNCLGSLSAPNLYHEPINIAGRDTDLLLKCLYMMLLIRKAEEKIGDMVTSRTVVGPAHLGIGQEAIAVGVAANLQSGDSVFGTHRSHSHFLALGNDIYGLFSEVLGKVTGCSRGMGGSQHLFGCSRGLMFTVPIVASTIPIAVGAGLAAKMDGLGNVAVCHFGDGAVEEGAAQESFNLASVMKLPVVFVCENNLFASHMNINERQPADSTARFGRAHGIQSYLIDGNDIVAVLDIAKQAIERARDGNGPSFVEAVTYRWRGHVGSREDLDVGVQRSTTLDIWKKRDPVGRLASALFEANGLSENGLYSINEEIRLLVEDAWARAIEAPYPDSSALLNLVYSK